MTTEGIPDGSHVGTGLADSAAGVRASSGAGAQAASPATAMHAASKARRARRPG